MLGCSLITGECDIGERHLAQSQRKLERITWLGITKPHSACAGMEARRKGQISTFRSSCPFLPSEFQRTGMGRRILNDALRAIVNAERRGKATVELQPVSNVISSFLHIMKTRGYIKNFQVFDPHRVGRIQVELHGRVNDCRALTYRQDIKARDIESYRVRALPTHQWGYIVVTTPDGILDHEEAMKRNVGGQILGYFH